MYQYVLHYVLKNYAINLLQTASASAYLKQFSNT